MNWLIEIFAPAIAAFNSLDADDWRCVRLVLMGFALIYLFGNMVALALASWLNETRNRPSLMGGRYHARRQAVLFMAYLFFGVVLMLVFGSIQWERLPSSRVKKA
jgi:hypothetical protein